ncbi:MAG TPA: arylesterase [Caulobacteraceae bacterium]|nr:arylesterase [Caulobacteraceae bacterium]
MTDFPDDLDRRGVLIGAGAALLAGGAGSAPVITVLGDSITAGYGLKMQEALPSQLQAALARAGVPARVRGAGVNGDTTAGGLARLERAVPGDTDVCVVALGGNDLLTGVSPSRTKANLDAIVRKLKGRGITPVLAGMRAPPLLGESYQRAFDAVWPSLAKAHGVALYPFLLDGVALNPRYNLSDRIHPNAQGIRIIAERLAPVVASTLKAGRRA